MPQNVVKWYLRVKEYPNGYRDEENMTKKDYELIADVIKNLDEVIDETAFAVLVVRLAGALAGDNPRFDGVKFAKACGVNVAI